MSSNLISRQLNDARTELTSVNEEISSLRKRKRELELRISALESRIGSANDDDSQYYQNDFPWSESIKDTLSSVFQLERFRSLQLAAINATMLNRDVILIMPTGGGKSLCFQLPAVLSNGVTIVVSPLISLMEDQLNEMNKLNINTAVINSQNSREESNVILKSITDINSGLKMIYVTPEKIAKSKMFMSQIEKLYRSGRMTRIVIDEVHCCSQWGHDFRTDYQYLNIMKTQFPETPILGLTATATETVIADVQKILKIEGCLVLKGKFYRDNLNYAVNITNLSKDQLIVEISRLLNDEFKDQSGIIYCLTIKDTEEVSTKLKLHGIRAEHYHAQLEGHVRSNVHQRWYKNKIQVIVATVAFGMGINKHDVRFVIHYSMSKSLENYYQETGRAGRDGKHAKCILFYRFADVFRATSLVFTEKNGLTNVYAMLSFCLNRCLCRKTQIAQYFGDEITNKCMNMCDNCKGTETYTETDVHKYFEDIIAILNNAEYKIRERMTALKLIDSWLCKGNKKLRLENVKAPDLTRDNCETIVGLLLIDGYLKEDFHFTPYSTISYLKPGPLKSVFLSKNDKRILYYLRDNSNKKKSFKRKNSLEQIVISDDEIQTPMRIVKQKPKIASDIICLD